jgi:hypothetical protein
MSDADSYCFPVHCVFITMKDVSPLSPRSSEQFILQVISSDGSLKKLIPFPGVL